MKDYDLSHYDNLGYGVMIYFSPKGWLNFDEMEDLYNYEYKKEGFNTNE